jgi:L-threonylcarbamoyladenylate synthase
MNNIFEATGCNIAAAARIIADGGIAAFPTETVYGLGADAFNARAVARVFAAKERPFFDPLIVHIADSSGLARLIDETKIDAAGRVLLDRLTAALWPGPLTLVLPKAQAVPLIVTGGLDTVAVRLPANAVARALIRRSGGAVAAPSANRFGCLSPTKAEHVAASLGVDMILDGGPCGIGIESTVLDLTVTPPRLLRPGGCPVRSIEEITGALSGGAETKTGLKSPGLLKSHYAPETPLFLYEAGLMPVRFAGAPGKKALVFYDGQTETAWNAAWNAAWKAAARREGIHVGDPLGDGGVTTYTLSKSGDSREAAAVLFDLLFRLDGGGFAAIHAEKVPQDADGDLANAINDRLTKASKRCIMKV